MWLQVGSLYEKNILCLVSIQHFTAQFLAQPSALVNPQHASLAVQPQLQLMANANVATGRVFVCEKYFVSFSWASNSDFFYQQAPMEYMDSDTESIWSAGLPFDNQWTREITARRNKRRGHRLGGGDKGRRGPNSTTIGNSSTRKSPPHPTPSGYMVELDGVTDTLVKNVSASYDELEQSLYAILNRRRGSQSSSSQISKK